MKTKFRILIPLVLLSAAWLAVLFAAPNAQPNVNAQTEPEVTVPGMAATSGDDGGMHTLADTVIPSMRYRSRIDLNQLSLTLDPLDIRSFMLNTDQIGVNRSVEVSPNTRAQKFVNPDGSQIIVLIIKSSGASGVRLHFRDFALADDEEVYVYGTAPNSIVFGPYTTEGPWDSGEFWTGIVDGDTVVVEFYKRTGEDGKAFEIFEISHIFSEVDWRLRSDQPDVLNCEVDASCPSPSPGPVSENNAVARIVFNDNGEYKCTGTLLNDIAEDWCPYFLTANHCVGTQAVANTVEVYWFYQTTTCHGITLRSWIRSPSGPGTVLLKTDSSNDISLLRLRNNAPQGAWFSGWTSVEQPINTSVFGLHHPGPYYPVSSPSPSCAPCSPSYLRRSVGSITSTNGTCLVNGYRIGWTAGLTEHGSSGSGLFLLNAPYHYLVGVLSCSFRPDTCPTAQDPAWDNYGKLHTFFPEIQCYIGTRAPAPPIGSPPTRVAAYSFIANWKRVMCNVTGYRLDVSTSPSFDSYVPGYQDLNVGNTLSRSVTGLDASTLYYYRVRAYNGNGASCNSNVVQLATLSATGTPVALTNPASLIASVSARLNGAVLPHGLPTNVYFRYGRTNAYGFRTLDQTKTGDTYQDVFANISNLTANTTYHFQIVATNVNGTRYGVDKTFTTLTTTGVPVVITNPATNVTNSSARLNGTVNPHGLNTTVYFQYGGTNAYGSRTLNQTKTGNNYQNVNANISPLTANTTYHFRIVAINTAGTIVGIDRTFTTPSTTCNIAGTWTGTVHGTYNSYIYGCSWTGDTQFSMVVSQNGTSISGPAYYNGIPCFNSSCGITDFTNSTGNITGTVNCPTVSLTYSGTVNGGGCSGAGVSETFNLTLNGNTLSGTGSGNHTITLTR